MTSNILQIPLQNKKNNQYEAVVFEIIAFFLQFWRNMGILWANTSEIREGIGRVHANDLFYEWGRD